MASTPKKVKTDDINQVVKTAISDMDTDLKAVCYDLSKNMSKPAIATIERVRRKLQALDGRTKCLTQVIHTDIQITNSTHQQDMNTLKAENFKLKAENKSLKEKVKTLAGRLQEYEDVFDVSLPLDESLELSDLDQSGTSTLSSQPSQTSS
jgi:FtsZ-binding cell division protein ZapB